MVAGEEMMRWYEGRLIEEVWQDCGYVANMP